MCFENFLVNRAFDEDICDWLINVFTICVVLHYVFGKIFYNTNGKLAVGVSLDNGLSRGPNVLRSTFTLKILEQPSLNNNLWNRVELLNLRL